MELLPPDEYYRQKIQDKTDFSKQQKRDDLYRIIRDQIRERMGDVYRRMAGWGGDMSRRSEIEPMEIIRTAERFLLGYYTEEIEYEDLPPNIQNIIDTDPITQDTIINHLREKMKRSYNYIYDKVMEGRIRKYQLSTALELGDYDLISFIIQHYQVNSRPPTDMTFNSVFSYLQNTDTERYIPIIISQMLELYERHSHNAYGIDDSDYPHLSAYSLDDLDFTNYNVLLGIKILQPYTERYFKYSGETDVLEEIQQLIEKNINIDSFLSHILQDTNIDRIREILLLFDRKTLKAIRKQIYDELVNMGYRRKEILRTQRPFREPVESDVNLDALGFGAEGVNYYSICNHPRSIVNSYNQNIKDYRNELEPDTLDYNYYRFCDERDPTLEKQRFYEIILQLLDDII